MVPAVTEVCLWQLRHQLALGSYKTAWLLCAKLRASGVPWRTMFERFPVGIVLRDADQRYMAANPAFQKNGRPFRARLVGLFPHPRARSQFRILSGYHCRHHERKRAEEALRESEYR